MLGNDRPVPTTTRRHVWIIQQSCRAAAACAGLALLVAPGQLIAQAPLDIPREYLAAHASGDTLATHRFVTRYYPSMAPERRASVARWLLERRARLGPLAAERFYEPIPQVASVVAHSGRDDYWYRIDFLYATEPALRIRGVGTDAASPLEAQPDGPFDLEDQLASLRTFVRNEARAGRFSGVLALRHGGQLLLSESWGAADPETRTPNTLDTPFPLASTSKLFVAVAIMRLVEQGHLDLTAPVGRYLPDYPNRAVRDDVTIAMLLSHQGGLGDIFTEEFLARSDSGQTLREVAAYFANDSLLFEPGSRYGYSNAGFVVLGLVLEAVAGVPFGQAVHELVLGPGGAPDAGWTAHRTRGAARPAVPLVRDDDSGRLIPERESGRLPPQSAGGGVASARDLLALDEALWSHRLVSEETLREMTTTRVRRGPMAAGGQGYGLLEVELLGQRMLGHNGGAPGVQTEYFHVPESGDALVLLANTAGPGVDQVIARSRALLARLATPVRP